MRTAVRYAVTREELEAQRIACRVLVEGCEAALASIRLGRAVARGGRELRTTLRAREILEEILASWRETLDVLDGAGGEERATKSPAFTPL